MELGASATGLSLVLLVGLVASVLLGYALAGYRRSDISPSPVWVPGLAGGYLLYLLSGLAAVELLGLFHALSRGPLLAWWVVYDLSVAAVAATLLRHRTTRGTEELHRPSSLAAAGAGGFAILVGLLVWLGSTTAPNNPDSMNYHLVRAATWATLHSPDSFPTNILYQISYGRLSEYFLAQTLILDGTDRLVFMPQLVAFVVSVALVGGLAWHLGGGRRGVVLATVLTATLPLGILQATTTQNDLFTAVPVLIAYYFTALLWTNRRLVPYQCILVAAAAGLALVSKEDATLVLAPLAVPLLVMVRRDHWSLARTAVIAGGAVVLVALLTLPMTFRNWEVFHNLNGPNYELTVTTHTPSSVVADLVKSALLDLDTMNPTINQHLQNVEKRVGSHLGWDHPTFQTSLFFTWPVPGSTPSEDASGNLVASVAVLLGLGLLASKRIRTSIGREHSGVLAIGGAGLVGMVLVMVVPKWQVYGARYQLAALLPLLASASVVIASIPSRLWFTVVGATLVVAGLFLAPFAALENTAKPIIGPRAGFLSLPRTQQYFWWCPGLQAPYSQAVDAVFAHHQTDLGYVSQPESDYVYPLWVLMSQQAHGAPVGLVQYDIDNQTRSVPVTRPALPAVVLISTATAAGQKVQAAALPGSGYRLRAETTTSCGVMGIYELAQ